MTEGGSTIFQKTPPVKNNEVNSSESIGYKKRNVTKHHQKQTLPNMRLPQAALVPVTTPVEA